MTKQAYSAEAIEVLTGLEPVKRRPGMYTDTTCPNHLVREVVDNSIDEAIAGYATKVDVKLYKDGSLEVEDNGRGMPVDLHPQYQIPAAELILTRLHAGGKFSQKNYQFSGGLHGVGISVVNALSARLEVTIKRDGQVYTMAFAHGEIQQSLQAIEKTKRATESGTKIRFWFEGSYFDEPSFQTAALQHELKAKAVLCPGLQVTFFNEASYETQKWCYQEGLLAYLSGTL
jgi:topoisomerase-4 subunit B